MSAEFFRKRREQANKEPLDVIEQQTGQRKVGKGVSTPQKGQEKLHQATVAVSDQITQKRKDLLNQGFTREEAHKRALESISFGREAQQRVLDRQQQQSGIAGQKEGSIRAARFAIKKQTGQVTDKERKLAGKEIVDFVNKQGVESGGDLNLPKLTSQAPEVDLTNIQLRTVKDDGSISERELKVKLGPAQAAAQETGEPISISVPTASKIETTDEQGQKQIKEIDPQATRDRVVTSISKLADVDPDDPDAPKGKVTQDENGKSKVNIEIPQATANRISNLEGRVATLLNAIFSGRQEGGGAFDPSRFNDIIDKLTGQTDDETTEDGQSGTGFGQKFGKFISSPQGLIVAAVIGIAGVGVAVFGGRK